MDMTLLRNIDLFTNLDAVQLAHVASIMTEEPMEKGKVLFSEGDRAEAFYVIASGRVRISKIVPGFGEEALAILNPGSYFGEMELVMPDQPRVAQAIVHESGVLNGFLFTDFHTLMNADSEFAMAMLWSMLRTMAGRLCATNDKLAAMFAMAQFG